MRKKSDDERTRAIITYGEHFSKVAMDLMLGCDVSPHHTYVVYVQDNLQRSLMEQALYSANYHFLTETLTHLRQMWEEQYTREMSKKERKKWYEDKIFASDPHGFIMDKLDEETRQEMESETRRINHFWTDKRDRRVAIMVNKEAPAGSSQLYYLDDPDCDDKETAT